MLFALLAALIALPAAAWAQDGNSNFPKLSGRVVDQANLIPADREAALTARLARMTTAVAPEFMAITGVGPDVASTLLVTAGDNPERLSHEAAFAALCGSNPIPASSGKTNRHRLNRGGSRHSPTMCG